MEQGKQSPEGQEIGVDGRIGQLIQAVNKADELRAKSRELQEKYDLKLKAIAQLMEDDLEFKLAQVNLGEAEHKVGILKEGLAHRWPVDGPQVKHEGYIIDRKMTRKAAPLEGKEHTLLIQALANLEDRTKFPATVKWDSRKLLRAVDVGYIGEDLVEITEHVHIAITAPKGGK